MLLLLYKSTGGVNSKLNSSCNCGDCRNLVNDKDLASMCSICDLWFRISCEDIGKYVYRFFMSNDKESIHWYCKSYNEVAGKILNINKLFKR